MFEFPIYLSFIYICSITLSQKINLISYKSNKLNMIPIWYVSLSAYLLLQYVAMELLQEQLI